MCESNYLFQIQLLSKYTIRVVAAEEKSLEIGAAGIGRQRHRIGWRRFRQCCGRCLLCCTGFSDYAHAAGVDLVEVGARAVGHPDQHFEWAVTPGTVLASDWSVVQWLVSEAGAATQPLGIAKIWEATLLHRPRSNQLCGHCESNGWVGLGGLRCRFVVIVSGVGIDAVATDDSWNNTRWIG